MYIKIILSELLISLFYFFMNIPEKSAVMCNSSSKHPFRRSFVFFSLIWHRKRKFGEGGGVYPCARNERIRRRGRKYHATLAVLHPPCSYVCYSYPSTPFLFLSILPSFLTHLLKITFLHIPTDANQPKTISYTSKEIISK